MKKNIPYILSMLGVVCIMLISEIVYSANNRPEFYLFFAKQAALLNDIQESASFLNKSARTVPLYSYRKTYQEYNPDSYSPPDFESTNIEFRKLYKDYFAKISIFSHYQDKTQYVAKIYYDLGLIAYKTNEYATFVFFLQNAIYLEPLFSYYPVELANYYLIQGNKDYAKKILDECLGIAETNEHCTQFLNNYLLLDRSDYVGFLKQRIELFVK